jgi:hypothetical protein
MVVLDVKIVKLQIVACGCRSYLNDGSKVQTHLFLNAINYTCNNMEALAHSTELVTDGNPLL